MFAGGFALRLGGVAAPLLVKVFSASGEAARLIVFFCRRLAALFAFFGTLFVCNAACNALGCPTMPRR